MNKGRVVFFSTAIIWGFVSLDLGYAAASHSPLAQYSARKNVAPQELFTPQAAAVSPDVAHTSPHLVYTSLVDVNKKIINALDQDRLHYVYELFNNYFDLIPYNMVIKDKCFYMSLFYLLFYSIGNENPFVMYEHDVLARLVKTSRNSLYVLEFSFSDAVQEFSYCFLDSGKEVVVPVIKIVCDVQARRLSLFGLKSPKSSRIYFFDDADCVNLGHCKNSRRENLGRKIFKVLSKSDFNDSDFSELLRNFYDLVPAVFRIGNEKYYQSIFLLVLNFVRASSSHSEVISSVGRSDVVIFSRDFINVIEFKFKKSATKALEQIEERRYPSLYSLQEAQKRMIGVNVKVARDNKVVVTSLSRIFDVPGRADFVWRDEQTSAAVRRLFE